MYSLDASTPRAASMTLEVFWLESWFVTKRSWPEASSASRRAPALVRGSTGDSSVEYCELRGLRGGRKERGFRDLKPCRWAETKTRSIHTNPQRPPYTICTPRAPPPIPHHEVRAREGDAILDEAGDALLAVWPHADRQRAENGLAPVGHHAVCAGLVQELLLRSGQGEVDDGWNT